jgi:hypothetical protein
MIVMLTTPYFARHVQLGTGGWLTMLNLFELVESGMRVVDHLDRMTCILLQELGHVADHFGVVGPEDAKLLRVPHSDEALGLGLRADEEIMHELEFGGGEDDAGGRAHEPLEPLGPGLKNHGAASSANPEETMTRKMNTAIHTLNPHSCLRSSQAVGTGGGRGSFMLVIGPPLRISNHVRCLAANWPDDSVSIGGMGVIVTPIILQKLHGII